MNPKLRPWLRRFDKAVTCMSDGARESWTGRDRVLFPGQCVAVNASAKTRPRPVRMGRRHVKECVRFVGVKFACGEASLKRRRHIVFTRDVGSVRRAAHLGADRQRERKAAVNAATSNATEREEKVRVQVPRRQSASESCLPPSSTCCCRSTRSALSSPSSPCRRSTTPGCT